MIFYYPNFSFPFIRRRGLDPEARLSAWSDPSRPCGLGGRIKKWIEIIRVNKKLWKVWVFNPRLKHIFKYVVCHYK